MSIKPRKPLISSILSFIFPGLGQIYNGQIVKGLILYGIFVTVSIMFVETRLIASFHGFIGVIIIELFIRLLSTIDAIVNSLKKKDYVLKKYNKWYFHFVIACFMFTILLVKKGMLPEGIQTIRQTTDSQFPVIKKGDFLVADTKLYELSEIDYGHIVVFKSPNNENWIFRVIGLPNDSVKIDKQSLKINSKECLVTNINQSAGKDENHEEYEIELPNGHTHRVIYQIDKINSTVNFANIVVPDDSYFLLGDNRTNAMDSRHIGFVNREKIWGRIIFSYYGSTPDRININFTNH